VKEGRDYVKRDVVLLLSLLLGFLAHPGSTQAQVYYVPGDFETIQEAIDAVPDWSIIELLNGTFTGNGNRDLSYRGKQITVRSQGGAANCIIDPEGRPYDRHTGFIFNSNEGPTSVLEGVTITDGDALGGGIRVTSSPVIRDCIIAGNRATPWHSNSAGGGIFCGYGSAAYFVGCTISANHAGGGDYAGVGGGAYISGSPTFENCAFQSNGADKGGSIYCGQSSHPTFLTCTFSTSGAERGGGVYCDNAAATFGYCLFVSNSAVYDGGALWCGGSSVYLSSCTFFGNYAEDLGTGVYLEGNSTATIANTIISFSRMPGEAVSCDGTSSATLSCCDVYGNVEDWVGCIAGQAGVNGNISLDPLFCDVSIEDFHIEANSPCRPFSRQDPGCDLIGALPVACGPAEPCDPPVVQPDQYWAQTYNSTGGHEEDDALKVRTDAHGNAYVTGMSSNGVSGYDIVTIKYDPTGSPAWPMPAVFDLDGQYDTPTGLALDMANDAVYVSGYSDHSLLVIRYAASTGQQVWASAYPANSNGATWAPGTPLGVDATGNVYVCGNCNQGAQCLVLKYAGATGVLLWDRFYSNPGGDGILRGVAVCGEYVYAAGGSKMQGNNWDVVTMRYELDGTLSWVQTFDNGSGQWDEGNAVVADAGGVYVVGASMVAGEGFDCLTLKYDSEGGLKWTRVYNGSANATDVLYDVALDGRGSVVACGVVAGATTGDDYVVLKYSGAGAIPWVRTYDGMGSLNDWACDVEVDENGDPYVTGGESEIEGEDSNIVTLKYDKQGIQQWLVRYDSPGASVDLAWALSLGRCGCAWVSGSMDTNPSDGWNDFDYVTINYCEPVPPGAVEDPEQPADESAVSRSNSLFVLGNSVQEGSASVAVFQLSTDGPASLRVFDSSGRLVMTLLDQKLSAGLHRVSWNGRDAADCRVPAGIYFLRLVAPDGGRTSRLVLLK
jgi:hypothetical protein